MSVTLRQLEAFRLVWAKGSLREAAIAMSVTHSAVHRLISQLETNINERLFDRDHGEARPTETAVTLASNVDRVMTSLDRVMALAHEETRINRASLRIGAITSFSPTIIPSALRVLRQQFQELRVSIDIQKQTDIETGFMRGDYDLCLVVLPLVAEIPSCERIGSLPRVCILPHGHQLTTRNLVTPADFAGEHFISIYRGSPMREVTDDLFKKAGIERITEIEARSSDMVCAMVASGLGISIVTGQYAKSWSQKLVIKPFRPEFRVEYGILRPAGAEKRVSTQVFINAASAVLQNLDTNAQSGE